jgi:hypothetical protein
MTEMTDVGPVEQGVRMFLSKSAHDDPAMSALALAAGKAVDQAQPGQRAHSYAVESLRKVLANLQSSAKPQNQEDDEFADLFRSVFEGSG